MVFLGTEIGSTLGKNKVKILELKRQVKTLVDLLEK